MDLSGVWKLRAEYLDVGADRWMEVVSRKPGVFSFITKDDTGRRMPAREGFLDAHLPGDISQTLIENGLLGDPMEKTNSEDNQWLDSLSWWLIRDFRLTRSELEQEQVRLFLETLDYNADIIINGRLAASHQNAFRPLDKDVKEFLNAGSNQIIIRLTSGYELYHPQDALTFYNNSRNGQRVYLRKPQFTHGWDWCKPVPTCGIGGRMSLGGESGALVRSFACETTRLDTGSAELTLDFHIDNLRVQTADDAIVSGRISLRGKTVHAWKEEVFLAGGINLIRHRTTVKNPELWWPNGSGEQPMYDIELSVTCRGVRNAMQRKRIGIRTIRIDMGRLGDGTRKFDFVVNGHKIFMKGGNWVPADSLYLRVPEEKYKNLVREAAACGSNMLRVWGGGLYEPDCFYDACSENGILIMQDFMYACGFYPDHLPWFMHEAALEADYQTKRLAHQACMAVWTGNNEIHESYTDWYGKSGMQPEKLNGAEIFNYLLPETMNKNCPSIPYMPSSPFFGSKANDLLAGDCHIWSWTRSDRPTGFKYFYELEAMDRIAEKVRFSSEYGFNGTLRKSSVQRFHAGEAIDRQGHVWKYHGEHDSKHRMIDPSINNHLTDVKNLDADNYLRYAGIAQGLMYQELALALRRREQTSGHLIWMYNDCWPETGWSVIDYYQTRKISFYFLKRAHTPFALILRQEGEGGLSLVVANDSPDFVRMNLETGYLDFDQGMKQEGKLRIESEPFSWREYALSLSSHEEGRGLYYVLDRANGLFATSLCAYYRDYDFPEAQVRFTQTTEGENTVVRVESDTFVPIAEMLTADDRQKMSDNYFAMLPGVPKEVVIEGTVENIRVEAVKISYAPKRRKSDEC